MDVQHDNSVVALASRWGGLLEAVYAQCEPESTPTLDRYLLLFQKLEQCTTVVDVARTLHAENLTQTDLNYVNSPLLDGITYRQAYLPDSHLSLVRNLQDDVKLASNSRVLTDLALYTQMGRAVVASGKVPSVKFLMERGLKIEDFVGLMEEAVGSRQIAMVDFIRTLPTDVNMHQLNVCVSLIGEGQHEMLHHLLECNLVDKSVLTTAWKRSPSWLNPQHLPVQQMMKYLLQQGVKPDPEWLSTIDPSLIVFLLNAGVSVSSWTQVPHDYAAVKVLLKHGFIPTADMLKKLVSSKGKVFKVIQLLLKRGVPINYASLRAAVHSNRILLVKLLLKHGADASANDHELFRFCAHKRRFNRVANLLRPNVF
jgi:hypothetical protein